MRKKLFRPWLTVSGVEISTCELREISKSWGEQTWSDYLNWFQSGNSEKLVSENIYRKISEELENNIFETFGYNSCPELQNYCDQLLSILPSHQQFILRSIFFEGKTQSQIAFEINRTKTCVSQNKYKAFKTLKREHDGEQLYARQYMRGAKHFTPEIKKSVWDEKLPHPIRDQRFYCISDYDEELLRHKNLRLREIFKQISHGARLILYLKYWCDMTHAQIAQKWSLGVNTVDAIIDHAIFKIKIEITGNLHLDIFGD